MQQYRNPFYKEEKKKIGAVSPLCPRVPLVCQSLTELGQKEIKLLLSSEEHYCIAECILVLRSYLPVGRLKRMLKAPSG